MESFGLYEDLSLFSGDLLVGVNPLANEFPSMEPDGGFHEFTKLQPQVDLFADEPIKPSSPDPIQDDWMDKKTDLIKLLSDPNVQITFVDELSSDVMGASSLPQSHVVKSPPDSLEYVTLQSMPADDVVSPEALLQNVTDFFSAELVDIGHNSSLDMSFGGLGDDIGDFSADGLESFMSKEELNALSAPILSPMSPQDIESILSSGPSSPASTASINDAVVPQLSYYLTSYDEPQTNSHEDYNKQQFSVAPFRTARASRIKKYEPYKDFDLDFQERKSPVKSSRLTKSGDRKERKKQQNKDAALRYRMKKKDEQHTVFEECDELEKKNEDLKDKVDGMTREIQYLKDLLLEVYKAKGIQPTGVLVK